MSKRLFSVTGLLLLVLVSGLVLSAVTPMQAQEANLNAVESDDGPVEPRAPQSGKTYTWDADFDEGKLINVNHDAPDNDQLQLDKYGTTFPFIWIALSGRSTVVKINTEEITRPDGTVVPAGTILGEYKTAPSGRGTNPSRTTVDMNGNVWVGNRNESSGGLGSAIHIGLDENFQCVDRNANGQIDTSTGLGDVKPWTNAGGADNGGGVTTADDECIIHYVRTSGTAVRHVTVDGNNDVWIGGYSNRKFDLVDGDTGTILKSVGPFSGGGYGGLVDSNGVMWSARFAGRPLRYDPATDQVSYPSVPSTNYGMGIDSQGYIWLARWSGSQIYKLAPDGSVVTGFPKASGGSVARGVAVDNNDEVWIANSHSNTVTRLDNNGNLLTSIPVCSHPVGIAIDKAGKIWAPCRSSHNVVRIDPATNQIDLTVALGNGADPYTYSDMTGFVALARTAPQGTWTVIYESSKADTPWGTISWNGSEDANSSLTVKARAANTEAGLGGETYVQVANGVKTATIGAGRYVQVQVTFRPGDEGADGFAISPVLEELTIKSNDHCVLVHDKTAIPDWVSAGGAVTVALSMRAVGECDAANSPVDVVLVMDRSGSMSGSKLDAAQTAAKSFVDKMDLSVDQVGLAAFSSSAILVQQLSQDAATIKSQIDSLHAGGGTNVQDGLEKAEAELISTRHFAKNVPVIVLLSDGHHNRTPEADLLAAATRIKGRGIRIITIGLGQNANAQQLTAIASSADDYYYAPSTAELNSIYDKIAPTMRVAARNMVLTDTLSSFVTLIPNTFGGPINPTTIQGDQVLWSIAAVPVRGLTLTYQVAMTTTAGVWPTNDSAVADYTDPDGAEQTITFPIPKVTVPLECTAPDPTQIEPIWACLDTERDVQISGSGFLRPFTPQLAQMLSMTGTFKVDAEIGGQALSIQNYSQSLIDATLAANNGLSIGKYDVKVINTCAIAEVPAAGSNGQAAPVVLPPATVHTGILRDGFRIYGPPHVSLIRPPEGYNDIRTEVTICGDGFAPGTEAFIEIGGQEQALENQAAYGEECLVGFVPEALPAGEYKIIVRGPCGEAESSFRSLSSELNNDLWGLREDFRVLVSGDSTICVADCEDVQLAFIAHRRGGKDPVEVNVRFYAGNPALGATLIGTGTIPLMSPGVPVPPNFNNTDLIKGVSTSLVDWDPGTGPLTVTLYAVIDPLNTVEEDFEHNNVISRTVHVIPCTPLLDRVAPRVGEFFIETNNDADVVYEPDVMLSYSATDFAGPGEILSGLSKVTFVEYLFQKSRDMWVPVQVTGWQPYTGRSPHTLYPASGLRFIQAWVSDQAGNISRFPNFKPVNYILPCDYVARNGVKIYRQAIDVGEQLYVEIVPCEPNTSDPDLYIWPPDWTGGQPPYVSNITGNRVEELLITDTVKGEYMIEVYGYTAARFNINIEVIPAGAGQAFASEFMARQARAAQADRNPAMLTMPSLNADSAPNPNGMPLNTVPFVEPLTGVTLSGSDSGWVNSVQAYQAQITPQTVMLPVTYTWMATDQETIVNYYTQDQVTDDAYFTWLTQGTKVVTVTVTNNSGEMAQDVMTTTIKSLPLPADAIAVSGGVTGTTGIACDFTASVGVTQSVVLPKTVIWEASDFGPVTRTVLNAQDVYSYTWTTAGTKLITVTASNGVGDLAVGHHTITITQDLKPTPVTTPTLPTADADIIIVFPKPMLTSTVEFTFTPPITLSWTWIYDLRAAPASGPTDATISHTPFAPNSDYILKLLSGAKTTSNEDVEPVNFTFRFEQQSYNIYLPLVLRTN